MIEVKSNYKFGQKGLLCRACNKMEERQEHLLECSALKENELVEDHLNYKDIYTRENDYNQQNIEEKIPIIHHSKHQKG